jgi:hypothetical protein
MSDSTTRPSTIEGNERNPVDECNHEHTQRGYIERYDGQHEITVCEDCSLILEDHGKPDASNVTESSGEN